MTTIRHIRKLFRPRPQVANLIEACQFQQGAVAFAIGLSFDALTEPAQRTGYKAAQLASDERSRMFQGAKP